MNRVFFMAMTMCMVLCLSTGASAQTKLTPKNAPATAKKAEVKQAKVPSKTKKVDVVFDKKQFAKLNKQLRKAGYRTMGQLAEANPQKVANVVGSVGFSVIDRREPEPTKVPSKKLSAKRRKQVALGMAKELVSRASKQKASVPVGEGNDELMGRVRNDDDNDELLENEWLITYDDTTDII